MGTSGAIIWPIGLVSLLTKSLLNYPARDLHIGGILHFEG